MTESTVEPGSRKSHTSPKTFRRYVAPFAPVALPLLMNAVPSRTAPNSITRAQTSVTHKVKPRRLAFGDQGTADQPAIARGNAKVCFTLDDDGDNFQGHDRSIPKTTPVAGPPTAIALADLLDSFRSGPTSDASMRSPSHDPVMERVCDFVRVDAENKNVQVEGWVVASRKESDNDFHVILSADPQVGQAPDRWRLMNVEIAGLPPEGTSGRDELVQARQQFRENFVPTVPDAVTQNYTLLEPTHVRITGSLFFDVDHPAGAVGPGAMKPATSWEIHPVTNLEVFP